MIDFEWTDRLTGSDFLVGQINSLPTWSFIPECTCQRVGHFNSEARILSIGVMIIADKKKQLSNFTPEHTNLSNDSNIKIYRKTRGIKKNTPINSA